MDESVSIAEKGVLYVVATPIGNLRDMTFRAVDILNSVDLVAAEDTRHTAKLLSFYNIRAKLIACHEHNEAQCAERLAAELNSGKSVALVSDAGTPAISDPGYRIVMEAVSAGIRVVPIPGPSAAIAALSASGMPSDMFCFVGFAPKKKGARDVFLQSLSHRKETLVFYESPRRLLSMLAEIQHHMGDRYVVVARELTKIHEEFLRGPVSEIIGLVEDRVSIKGEVTLLVAGTSDKADVDENRLEEEILQSLSERRLSPSRLAASLAKRYNVSKNDIYQAILAVQSRMDTRGSGSDKGGPVHG